MTIPRKVKIVCTSTPSRQRLLGLRVAGPSFSSSMAAAGSKVMADSICPAWQHTRTSLPLLSTIAQLVCPIHIFFMGEG
jgi:hypothetical protein